MLRLGLMHSVVFTIFATFLFACGGSSKKPTKASSSASSSVEHGLQQPARDDENEGDRHSNDIGDDLSWLRPVYFAFDSSDLAPATRDTLTRLHAWLSGHPDASLTIEGHCDEQGTEEYNIALGQKRAQVVVDYLARLGTEAQRLTPTSYGALRPAVEGHDETAWSQNRRGEFRVSP